VTLADQIIEHEPWSPDALGSIQATGDELNELRAELLELRRLRAALASFTVSIDRWVDPSELDLTHDDRHVIDSFTKRITLADLVRRADEHTEGCR